MEPEGQLGQVSQAMHNVEHFYSKPSITLSSFSTPSRDPEKHICIPASIQFGGSTYHTYAMLDSGATNNFINQTFLLTTDIQKIKKESPIELLVVDGRPIKSGAVTHETATVTMLVQEHQEEISFDITSIGAYPIILGLPWLSSHNPEINWSNHEIQFVSSHCKKHCIVPNPVSSASPVSEVCETQEIADLDPSPKKLSLQAAEILSVYVSPNSFGMIDPAPATDDDELVSPAENLVNIVPPDFHSFLSVFDKSNSDKLPGHGPYDHTIPLKEGTQPKFGPVYRLSEVELKALDEYLKNNLRNKFIRPSTSPAGSPILFVKKSDGSLRLCVDYRSLNGITIKNRYPLPLIGESLDRLSEASWFSKIDLRAAYHLIRIKEGDEWKTAFRTRYGLYEYQVMPFGLTNAPASFQNLINDVLREYLDLSVIVYLDDILIFSKTREEHVVHVKQVLEKLKENQLWANAEKCLFFQSEVGFLGFIASKDGIKMDPKKVEAITDWKTPRNVKGVQSFLGFANFYRRFIKSFSKIATPLTALTKKDVAFKWTEMAEDAFLTLKKAFTTAPILQHFSPNRPIVIETDASDYAIAGIISHPDEQNQLRPIAFYSRKLTDVELNYEIYDKEMLAIVWAFKEWRAYLEGSKEITVYTDHKNLEYFTTSKVLNRRQARWGEVLAHYDFKIIYRSGAQMGKADALTRRQDLQEGSRAADAPPQALLKPGQFVISATDYIAEDIASDIIKRIKTSQQEDPVHPRIAAIPTRPRQTQNLRYQHQDLPTHDTG